MGKLVSRDISCFILMLKVEKTCLFNRKDEVLIKVLVELGGSLSFLFPPKAPIVRGENIFFLRPVTCYKGSIYRCVNPPLRVSKIQKNFCKFLVTLNGQEAPHRGLNWIHLGGRGFVFFHSFAISIAHIYKSKMLRPKRNANKFRALTSVWLGFLWYHPAWYFLRSSSTGLLKKPRFRSLGISVVPCWKWLASGKLSEDSKESLRWGMTFLSGGKVVANPTTTFPSKFWVDSSPKILYPTLQNLNFVWKQRICLVPIFLQWDVRRCT